MKKFTIVLFALFFSSLCFANILQKAFNPAAAAKSAANSAANVAGWETRNSSKNISFKGNGASGTY